MRVHFFRLIFIFALHICEYKIISKGIEFLNPCPPKILNDLITGSSVTLTKPFRSQIITIKVYTNI